MFNGLDDLEAYVTFLKTNIKSFDNFCSTQKNIYSLSFPSIQLQLQPKFYDI